MRNDGINVWRCQCKFGILGFGECLRTSSLSLLRMKDQPESEIRKMIPLSIIRQWGYDFNRRTIGTPYHIWISPYYIWSKMIRIWKVIEWKAIPVFMEIVKIRWFYIRSNFPKGNCRQKISSSTGEDWRTFVRQQLCKSVALLRTRWMSLENKIILSVTKSLVFSKI